MALVVPDVGEVLKLAKVLYTNTVSSGGNLTLKLYQTDITPAESDTHTAYDTAVCTFTNYVNKTLTAASGGSNWSAATTSSGTTSSTYGGGSPQSWTCGADGDPVYGYQVQTSTPVLQWAEKFSSVKTLTNGDTLNLTPYIECA
jgi:hypothetical protein